MRRERRGGGLVAWVLQTERLICIGAVLAVFYFTVPWGLIFLVLQMGAGLSPAAFTAVINAWATGLADNNLVVVVLVFVAVLTYGPEVLDLVSAERR